MSDTVVRTAGLTKYYGQVQAVRDVDFEVREGEIMALVGDNGAGKSTLIQLLSGVIQPTDGDISLFGENVELNSYRDAQTRGIETVYQDLALAQKQSVAQNIFLGDEPTVDNPVLGPLGIVDRSAMREQSRAVLERINIPIDPKAQVTNLSGGQRQAVAIGRALKSDPEILILDEPTSALSVDGAENVSNLIRELNEKGQTIVIISHDLREIFSLSDRITVLSNGVIAGVEETEGITREEIIALMMGQTLDRQEV